MTLTDLRGLHRTEVNNGTITALVGAIAAVITAFVAGLWQHLSGRKKGDVEAHGATISGFIALIGQLQARIGILESQNSAFEINDHKQDRRIGKLEKIMRDHNIEVPGDEDG